MADLSTLDETKPTSDDPIREGDDKIRETRAAVKTSMAVEHTLGGMHKIPRGSLASRPLPGNPGRLYINTDTRLIEVDNTSSWVAANAVNGLSATLGAIIPITTLSTGLVSCVVSVTGLCSVMIIATAVIWNARDFTLFKSGEYNPVTVQLFRDTNQIAAVGVHVQGIQVAVPMMFLDTLPALGTNTYTLKAISGTTAYGVNYAITGHVGTNINCLVF